MGFFDELDEPAPEPPPSYREPEWIGPPDNWIPATVALDVALARTDSVAVWVADALVFPTGLSFGINVQWRGPEPPRREPLFFGLSTADDPRFGVELADGRKVIAAMRTRQPFHMRPDRPILRPRSGGGGGNRHRADLWLWPLPALGPLAFVFAWPAEQIPEMRATIDADPIIDAASRAVEMWPDERPLPPREDDVVI